MRWYVSHHGKTEGPLEEHEVLQRIRSGELDASSYGAPEGASQWELLSAHAALAAAFAPPSITPGAFALGAASRGGASAAASTPGPASFSSGGASPKAGSAAGAKKKSPTKTLLLAGGGCALLGLLASCCVAGYFLWPAQPPDLEVVSAEIVLLPPDPHLPPPRAGEGPRHDREVLRVRYRTEPNVVVELDGYTSRADDDGEGVVERDLFDSDRERTVTGTLVAQESPGTPETRRSVRADREPRLFPLADGFACSYGECRISSDYRGTLTARAPTGGSMMLGTSAATPPDPTEDILRHVDPASAFGAGELTLALPVRFTFADGAVLTEQYRIPRMRARTVLIERFRGAQRGAVTVPAEATGNAILWITSARDAVLFGRAQRAGDIGRVAIDTLRPQRRQCGSYAGRSGVRRLYVERGHRVIRVYDRRTGRLADTHTLEAERVDCPRTVDVRPGTGDIFWSRSTVPDASVRAWLERQ